MLQRAKSLGLKNFIEMKEGMFLHSTNKYLGNISVPGRMLQRAKCKEECFAKLPELKLEISFECVPFC